MFRPLMAIFRRKYTIIILGSYLYCNGSVGFYWILFIAYVVVAYVIWVCELFRCSQITSILNVGTLKIFKCSSFFLGFPLRFVNIVVF
jgi:hypothetical protein